MKPVELFPWYPLRDVIGFVFQAPHVDPEFLSTLHKEWHSIFMPQSTQPVCRVAVRRQQSLVTQIPDGVAVTGKMVTNLVVSLAPELIRYMCRLNGGETFFDLVPGESEPDMLRRFELNVNDAAFRMAHDTVAQENT